MPLTLAVWMWTAPALLGGLVLLGLPILAHLLNQKVRRRLTFPSLRFLQESSADRQHLLKLRRRLLLALRALAVILAVFAFARPRWYGAAAAGGEAGSRGAVVVLADISASLARREGGVPLIHHLGSAAARVLDDVTATDDLVNLVWAGARPEAAFPELTANLPAVQQELRQLEVRPERADLGGAIALAGRMLAEHQGPRRLVVLSDLQASNWGSLTRSAGVTGLPPGTEVTVVELPDAVPTNLALADPALYPAVPVAGQDVELTVRVRNLGTADAAVPVELLVDGNALARRPVQLAPFEEQELSFTHQFDEARPHQVSFALGDDELAVDNEVFLGSTVVEQPPIVVVSDMDPAQPGTSAFYLVRALSPHGDRRDQFAVRYLRSYELNESQLQQVLAVLVCDADALSGEAVSSLAAFMERGGGVVWYASGPHFGANALAVDKAIQGGCLPWVPQRERVVPAERPLLFKETDWAASALRSFDPASREAVSAIPITRCWFARSPHEEARVVMRYADGLAALGYRELGGGGRCVIANFSPDRAAGTLGPTGFFVALNHSLIEDMQSATRMSVRHLTGQSMVFTTLRQYVPNGPQVSVVGPGDTRITDVDYVTHAKALTVSVANCPEPGFYSARQGEEILGLAAANVDPRESDLRRVEPDVLAKSLQAAEGGGVRWVATAAGGAVLPERFHPLWGWMFGGALLALMAEMTLLGIWRT